MLKSTHDEIKLIFLLFIFLFLSIIPTQRKYKNKNNS